MDIEIKIKKANIRDLHDICMLFEKATRNMNENMILQWDELYPTQEIIRGDILNNQMYLGVIENQIASVFVLNQQSDAEYANGNWRYKDFTYAVVHRLCVDPQFQKKGIGTKTMQQIENILKSEGTAAIRLDAFSLNPYALRMYEKLGYMKVGEVNWRTGLFYLYEKLI